MILMYKSIDLLERNVFGMDSIKVDAVCTGAYSINWAYPVS